MSALLTVRIPENEKIAIERAAASGRYVREMAWLEEKVAKARASRDLSEAEVTVLFKAMGVDIDDPCAASQCRQAGLPS